MIRALVVDDEEVARLRLVQMLAAIPDVQVVGEAVDGDQAMRQVAELRPDLLLLDIQMPGASGLDVAASLPSPRPKIVFCTAFDQHAIEAFELEALDYLLKPVSRVRLARAVDRVRRPSAEGEDDRIERVTRSARLLARCGDHYRVIAPSDVVCFTSEDGLTKVHTRDRGYVLDLTLNDLERRLASTDFFRISRSALVKVDSILEVHPLSAGMADIVLTTGARLEVSRRRLGELMDRLRAG